MIIRKLVEIYTHSSSRDVSSYAHTYIASRRDMCYHMYIHIEITVTHINTLMCLYYMLDIDWAYGVVCPDAYIHYSMYHQGLRDVL